MSKTIKIKNRMRFFFFTIWSLTEQNSNKLDNKRIIFSENWTTISSWKNKFYFYCKLNEKSISITAHFSLIFWLQYLWNSDTFTSWCSQGRKFIYVNIFTKNQSSIPWFQVKFKNSIQMYQNITNSLLFHTFLAPLASVLPVMLWL
jgi:hypothetical protein